jgi:hypothetical protein
LGETYPVKVRWKIRDGHRYLQYQENGQWVDADLVEENGDEYLMADLNDHKDREDKARKDWALAALDREVNSHRRTEIVVFVVMLAMILGAFLLAANYNPPPPPVPYIP